MNEDEIKRPEEATDLKKSTDKIKGYKNYYPKWISAYVEGGNTIFSDYELGGFRRTANRYDEEYIPAMELLVDSLGKTKSPVAGVLIKGIAETIKLMKDVVDYIDVIVGDNTTNVVSQDDIGNLFQSMSMIEQQMIDYNKLAMQDEETKAAIKEVQDVTKVDLDSIEKTSKLASGMFKRAAPRKGIGARLQEFSPEGMGLGKELLQGVAAGMLGPLGGLGAAAVSTVGGIVKRRKEKKVSRQRKQFASSVMGGVPYIPEEEFEIAQETRGTGVGLSGDIEGIPGSYQDNTGRMHDPSGKFISQNQAQAGSSRHATSRGYTATQKATVGAVAATGVAAGGMSLFTFFDKHAKNAKWTKEVLSLLTKMEKKIRKGVGGGGGGIVETAIGGAVGAGAAAGGLGLGAKLLAGVPLAGLAVGTGLSISDAMKAPKVAEREGWLGPKGERVGLGKGVAASVGGVLGGTGKGIGEDGATGLGIAKNIGVGALKGAGIGATIGSVVPVVGTALGAGVGAAIGGITHAIGGKRMAKAAKMVWDVSPLGMAVNAGSKLASGFKQKKIDKEMDNIKSLREQNLKLQEKRRLTESIDIKKQEIKTPESKQSSVFDMKKFEFDKMQKAVASDKDFQSVAGSMKKIQDIGMEKIVPIVREEIAPAVSSMLIKLEAAMKENAKAVKAMAEEKGTAIMNARRGKDDATGIGDAVTEILNTGFIGVFH